MDIIVVAFLIGLIFALGIITSYSDLKEGKIRNVVIFPAILLGVIINLIWLQFPSLLEFGLNAVSAFGIGFFLWLTKLWSAADSKLFLAYAVLVPHSFYMIGGMSYFPSVIILFNTFVPVFLVMSFRIIAKTSMEEKVEGIKETFDLRTVAGFAVMVFALSWPIQLLFSFYNIESNLFIDLFLIFLLIEILRYFLSLNLFIISLIISALRFVFDYASIFSTGFLLWFLFILLSFLLMRYFILYLGILAYGKKTPIESLKEGMFILNAVVEKNGRIVKTELFQPTLFNIAQNIKKKFLIDFSKPLTKKDLQNLEVWKKKGILDFNSLRVQGSLPFAPFIFLGVLLTLFFKGNIIYYLLPL